MHGLKIAVLTGATRGNIAIGNAGFRGLLLLEVPAAGRVLHESLGWGGLLGSLLYGTGALTAGPQQRGRP